MLFMTFSYNNNNNNQMARSDSLTATVCNDDVEQGVIKLRSSSAEGLSSCEISIKYIHKF